MVEGATNCDDLKLRWERPAGAVVSAFADQPFRDWGSIDDEVPPPLMAAVVEGTAAKTLALLAVFREGGVRRSTSTAEGHIILPQRCDGPQPQDPQGNPVPDTDCVRTDASQYIAFAVRKDLAPANGLSDMRETGSAFNARVSLQPAPGTDPDVQTVGDAQYQIYVTANAWNPSNVFGREWSIR